MIRKKKEFRCQLFDVLVSCTFESTALRDERVDLSAMRKRETLSLNFSRCLLSVCVQSLRRPESKAELVKLKS